MIITVKRRFQDILRKHLSETVTSEDQVKDDTMRQKNYYLKQSKADVSNSVTPIHTQ